MKKLFLFLFFAIQAVTAHPQQPHQEPQPKPKAIDTTFIKGKAHPVYLGPRGGQYIIVMKQDSTGTYKKYLPKKQ